MPRQPVLETDGITSSSDGVTLHVDLVFEDLAFFRRQPHFITFCSCYALINFPESRLYLIDMSDAFGYIDFVCALKETFAFLVLCFSLQSVSKRLILLQRTLTIAVEYESVEPNLIMQLG